MPNDMDVSRRMRRRIDAGLPFYDLNEARHLIASGVSLGTTDSFRVAARLAVPIYRSRCTFDEIDGLLNYWEALFKHPLTTKIAAVCRLQFAGRIPSAAQIRELVMELRYRHRDSGLLEVIVTTCGESSDFDFEDIARELFPADIDSPTARPAPRSHRPCTTLGVCDSQGYKLIPPSGLAPKALLAGAVTDDADMWDAQLSAIDLEGAQLDHARLAGASFEDSNLFGARLNGATLAGARFTGADLRDASLIGARLMYARFKGAKLQKANLLGADLGGAVFEGVHSTALSGAIMPDGRPWDEYRRKHLEGIVDSRGDLAKVVDAWEETVWARCPLHAVFGWRGLGDAPRAIQSRIGCWQAFHDSGLLERPEL